MSPRAKKTANKIPGKGGLRWYKNVGLGFKTPKEAIEGACDRQLGAASSAQHCTVLWQPRSHGCCSWHLQPLPGCPTAMAGPDAAAQCVLHTPALKSCKEVQMHRRLVTWRGQSDEGPCAAHGWV